MFACRTPSHVVRVARLDAGFYDPVYVENASKVERHAGDTIANLCPRLLDHSFLTIRTEDYLSAGVPFVRVKNLKGMVLDEDFIFINEEANQRESQTICIPGDLLFAKTGKIAACPVPLHVQQVNTSQDVMVGTVRHGTDPYYVAAYLNCRHGTLYQERYVQGPVQPHLSLGSLRQIYVATPRPDAQRYIGDKVRQAERLRERARRLEAQAHSALAEWNGNVVPPTFRETPRRVLAATASPHSLGPSFAWAMQGHRGLPRAKPLSSFVESCACGEPIRADQRTPGPYLYYGASGPIDTHNEYNFEGEYLVVAQDGTIGRACVARGRFWANNHVWILKVREAVDPDAVAAYLDKHYVYWPGLTTGSVVPKVTSENLMLAAIPSAVASAANAGAKFRNTNGLRSAAEWLVDVAKLLVEHLINGRINEADLVAAQKALEAGDRSADCEILKDLRQSDAPDAKPLIADVDALYALLDTQQDAP